MAEKVAKVGIEREPGFIYFLRGTAVVRAPMRAGPASGPTAEQLAVADFTRAAGWAYYVDGDGDVSRQPDSTAYDDEDDDDE